MNSNIKLYRASKNLLLALLPLILISLACSRLTAFKANLFEGNNAEKAVAEIKNKVGKSFKVTEIVIEKDNLRINVQDPNNPQNLDEYKYVAGFITGPTPVKLNALNDNLEKSSFPIDEINFAAVPQMIADALKQTAIEGGKVSKMTFQRGFAIVDNDAGSLGSARWNIEIVGTRENASAAANPQGKITGVNLSQTSRGANYKVTTKEELQKAQDALRDAFGANGKAYKILIYDKYVLATMPNSKNPNVTDDYKFDLNGLTKGGLVQGTVSNPLNELFPLSDINLPDVADYIEKTRTRTGLANASIASISIQRNSISVLNKGVRNTIDVSLKSGVSSGMVIYDLANGEEVSVYKDGKIISKK